MDGQNIELLINSLKCEKVLPSNDNLVKMMEKSKSPKEQEYNFYHTSWTNHPDQ